MRKTVDQLVADIGEGMNLGRMRRFRPVNGVREFDEVPSGQLRERLPKGIKAPDGSWWPPLRSKADVKAEVGELTPIPNV